MQPPAVLGAGVLASHSGKEKENQNLKVISRVAKHYKKGNREELFMKKSGRKVTAMLLAAALTVSGLPGLLAAEAEAAPLETVGKNLVLGKDVIASSTANNAGPELAVDGVKDQPQQWNSDDMKSWTASDTSRDEEEQTPSGYRLTAGQTRNLPRSLPSNYGIT